MGKEPDSAAPSQMFAVRGPICRAYIGKFKLKQALSELIEWSSSEACCVGRHGVPAGSSSCLVQTRWEETRCDIWR